MLDPTDYFVILATLEYMNNFQLRNVLIKLFTTYITPS